MSNLLQNIDDYAYVVGIDFGTTYSGCCYAFTKDSFDDFQDITAWPKQRNAAYPKTPTVMLYKSDSQEVLAWGDGARHQAERPNLQDHLLERFKLYLDELTSPDLPDLPNGLIPIQVISDYLRLLHEYICEQMKRGFAQNYDKHQFRYCLTVPAMWSDKAKTVMREACILAGIINRGDPTDRLMLISEPEAAALYCQKTCDQFRLGHGQRFMICDAGGGTVDLIVFEIDDSGEKRSLKEVTKGSGDSCGSTFLDKNMEQLIIERFQHFGEVKRKALDQMMTTFIERVKPQFNDDDDDDEHFIPIPFSLGYPHQDNEENGIIDGTLVFSTKELKQKVFDPVVNKVIGLIADQLNGSTLKPVDAIFMVGGFGKSTYLHRCVERTFVPRVQFVGIPPRAEMAVVRGAVYFGLNPTLVSQRVLRRTYGLSSQIRFDDARDPRENRILVNNIWYCKQRFSVFANKGQEVGVNECVTKKYHVMYPHSTETDLYAFDEDGTIPRLSTDPKVKAVARFPVHMPTFSDLKVGDVILMLVNMYFGQTEIKIEVIIRDHRQVFTSRLDFMSESQYSQNNMSSTMASPSPTLTYNSSAPPPYSPGMHHVSPSRPSPPSSSSSSAVTPVLSSAAISSTSSTTTPSSIINNKPLPVTQTSFSKPHEIDDSTTLYNKPHLNEPMTSASKPHLTEPMSPTPTHTVLQAQYHDATLQHLNNSRPNMSQLLNHASSSSSSTFKPLVMTTGSYNNNSNIILGNEKTLEKEDKVLIASSIEKDDKVLIAEEPKSVTKKPKGLNKLFGKLKKT
ncbi:unnamed protein product [Cunninghamella blakesleeana]